MFNSKTANQHLSTIAERITEMPFEPEIFNNTERHEKGIREREVECHHDLHKTA